MANIFNIDQILVVIDLNHRVMLFAWPKNSPTLIYLKVKYKRVKNFAHFACHYYQVPLPPTLIIVSTSKKRGKKIISPYSFSSLSPYFIPFFFLFFGYHYHASPVYLLQLHDITYQLKKKKKLQCYGITYPISVASYILIGSATITKLPQSYFLLCGSCG